MKKSLKCYLSNLWFRAVLLLFTMVLISSLFIVGAQPIVVGLFPHPIDKIVHATFYGGLTTLVWLALGMRRELTVFFSVVLIAVIDEWHQAYLPGRSSDFMDLFVDVMSIALVIMVVCIFQKNDK